MKSEQSKRAEQIKTLEDNKTKVLSATLTQCDEGILKTIERYDGYEQNKTGMYWILKKIRLVGKSPTSSSPDNLERTLQLTSELVTCKQGRMTFANYYREFASVVQTMEDEDAVPAEFHIIQTTKHRCARPCTL